MNRKNLFTFIFIITILSAFSFVGQGQNNPYGHKSFQKCVTSCRGLKGQMMITCTQNCIKYKSNSGNNTDATNQSAGICRDRCKYFQGSYNSRCFKRCMSHNSKYKRKSGQKEELIKRYCDETCKNKIGLARSNCLRSCPKETIKKLQNQSGHSKNDAGDSDKLCIKKCDKNFGIYRENCILRCKRINRKKNRLNKNSKSNRTCENRCSLFSGNMKNRCLLRCQQHEKYR